MPLGRRTFLTALAGTTGAAVATPALADAVRPRAAPSPTAAAASARRLLPRHAGQLSFRSVPARAGDDVFRVSGESGAITIEGSTPAVQLTGLRTYLKQVAHANITWAGEQLDLPERLPAPARELTGSSDVPHRFVLNDTNDGYTGPYHDWAYWEREIDVLALHGYNEVLVYTGADALYHRLFQQFGFSSAELRAWVPGPAHQPWWLLQNLSSFPHPVSARLLDARAALGLRIVRRLRELGMTPVLPGYFGTVPPGFDKRNSGTRVVPQGTWMGFDRPDWLDPRTAGFAKVAAAFYRLQDEMYGATTMYKMDLLHEGGTAGDVPVPDAAKGVEKALRAAHSDAIWVILGWQKNPPRAIVDAVDRQKMLVVDGLSDRRATVVDREDDWNSTPYTFGSIWNFGGHTTLGGNAPDWAHLYDQWRTKQGSMLRGIALMPEAGDNNPAAFELFSELPWTEGPIDLRDWFAQYAEARYGERDEHAEAAWDVLRETAYGTTRADSWSEQADGLFGARPSLTATSAGSWSPKAMRYDPAAFEPALTELLLVASPLRSSSAYRRDLLDVARQALSNRSRVMLPALRDAYETRDRTRFGELTKRWLTLMELLDQLVATDRDHLLGRWVADARAWGADAGERDQLEYDALSLLTVWGARKGADAGLRDYANREWAGLVGGLYVLRWRTWFDELATALKEGREPKAVDWFALEDRWTRAPGRLATKPAGDTYRVAVQVRDALAQQV
ncbi:alpha-N-acetylglucosaminidase [Streptomyces tsukubensis]|uniref:Alpha-N-acetylglucosaminidase n=1 Tax=Streptomyces tsukubensis TaxID=83656 RepID=A0A1V4ADR0_9ACTN|nr:alpha-N-acetylglucosaminidase [Streptomyces tsukubensis]OON81639.1 alpha-N-acetylglucosaminidase [Streptomyces tsukubensis]QFR96414.1 alpha-N-acetylglucosaminidase [Streptomyces tsukubensis]